MTLPELWNDLRFRLRAALRRGTMERDLHDELTFHLDRETEKLVRAGVRRDEAERRARLAFGGLARIKDDARDARGTAMLEHFVQDVRYALRGLRAQPFFTVVIIATLALGVGTNAAMFGVIDRAMFRAPALLRDPSSVNRVFTEWSGPDGKRSPQHSFEYREFRDFAHWSQSTAQIAGFAYRKLAIGDGANARELTAGAISAEFFSFFDARPIRGRFFDAAEDQPPAGSAVVVLSYAFWQSNFDGRDNVLGAPLTIGPKTYRIIGVAPEGFVGFTDEQPVAFIPLTAYAAAQSPNFYKNYNWSWMDVVVRRKPGVSAAQASTDLSHAFLQSWNSKMELSPKLAKPEAAHPTAFVAPIQLARGPTAGPTAAIIMWVSGVALIVLLIACANVANLLLARSIRRRRELAVRRALGGSRGRLVRQLLAESLTLACFGGIAGLIGAQLASRALLELFAASADASMTVLTDSRTLAFAFAVTAITAILAGVIPAFHSGSDDLAGSLRGGTREGAYRGSRLRTALLVFQTMLSVVLLVGAGLFVRSVRAVEQTRLGFDVDPIIYIEPNLRGAKLSPAEETQLTDRLLGAARAIPGVQSATPTTSVPFWSFEGHSIFVAGIDSVRKLGRFLTQAGSADYFNVLGTRIVRGRGFSPADRADAPPVVVVSDAMGKALWKDADPIGKCIRINADTMPCTIVIGVAENVRAEQITDGAEFAYYLPMDQYRKTFGDGLPYLYVRVNGNADDYADMVRARLQREMPDAAYIVAKPMHEIVDPMKRSWTSAATMFTALGGLALVLAAIGLYAVVAFSVAQRRNEIGVRIALGALPSDVLRLVVGEGVRVTLAGVALGGAIAFVGARRLEPLLFAESPRDPAVFVGVAAVLIIVGAIASVVPAARAARVDPNVALRTE